MTSVDEKNFVIRHVFPQCMPGTTLYGKEEKHFGIPWRISGFLSNSTYYVSLECLASCLNEDWWIRCETNSSIEDGVSHVKKTLQFSRSQTTNVILMTTRDYRQSMDVEVWIKITNVHRIESRRPRKFDESVVKYDVILVVNGKKFHLTRKDLASKSTYFNNYFLSNPIQKEWEIKNVDPGDFQNFLELIYGEPAVLNEFTIDGILHLSHRFDSKSSIKTCQDFLISKSEKSLKYKFHVAIKYKLEELKKKCFGQMKTKNDVISCASEDNGQFDKDVWKELFHKLASFG